MYHKILHTRVHVCTCVWFYVELAIHVPTGTPNKLKLALQFNLIHWILHELYIIDTACNRHKIMYVMT